jgi:hypothetical protein
VTLSLQGHHTLSFRARCWFPNQIKDWVKKGKTRLFFPHNYFYDFSIHIGKLSIIFGLFSSFEHIAPALCGQNCKSLKFIVQGEHVQEVTYCVLWTWVSAPGKSENFKTKLRTQHFADYLILRSCKDSLYVNFYYISTCTYEDTFFSVKGQFSEHR